MTTNQTEIVRLEGVSKSYQIYDSPQARLKQAIWRNRKKYYQDFWALKNVSFSVNIGESLGIIGRNGSGKSTLLQLVCGTLNPTKGIIKTRGKVAALLELGSGFNPEFSGIENIYLNASMLGLSKEETDNQFDNILSFADIGDFVNQPIKTYSTGMSLRLAFAVIAHVSADILIVDEALAVGDAVFVQRCMRFIRKMREEKCLLFVSHDVESVKSLCDNALWLSQGETRSYGNCKEVTLKYLRHCSAEVYGEENTLMKLKQSTRERDTETKGGKNNKRLNTSDLKDTKDYQTTAIVENNITNAEGWTTGKIKLCSVTIRKLSDFGDGANLFKGGEEVEIEISAMLMKDTKDPIIGFVVKDRLGLTLFGENTDCLRKKDQISNCSKGDVITARFRLWLPMLPCGEYGLLAAVAEGSIQDNVQHYWAENALTIKVTTSQVRYGLVGAFISGIEFESSNI